MEFEPTTFWLTSSSIAFFTGISPIEHFAPTGRQYSGDLKWSL